MTDEFFDLLDAIENVISHINDNGGFTVVGWYRRGTINDRTLVESRSSNNTTNGRSNNNTSTNEDIQVVAGEMTYHVVELYPTNRSLMDKTSILGEELHEKKFDVARFAQV